MSSQPHRRTAAENFLYSESEKSDYDWLVSPPGSPTNQLDAPDALKSRLWNFLEEERHNVSSENKTMLFRPSSSSSSRSTSRPSTPTRRPSSSGTSRATSTSARATLTSSATKLARRPSSSGTSRSTVTAARATATVSSTNSSRSTSRASTPTRRPSSSSGTSRVTLTGARATPASNGKQSNNRPMTAPNSKPGSRSSTPTCRPSTPTGSSSELKSKPNKPAPQIIDSGTSTRSNNRPMTAPDTKPGSRLGTPIRCPSTPTGSSTVMKSNLTKPAQQITGLATSTRSNNWPMTAPNSKPGSRSGTPTRRPPTPTGSSATILKTKPSKPIPSQILRSRPWEPYEMPGFSLEAPSNLRTMLPDRPQNDSSSSRITRAFDGASSRSSSRSASIERAVPRRQSLSPSTNRAPIGNNDSSGLSNPVAKGNQMVEKRVINMRKLAPPTEKGGRGGSGGLTAGKSRSGSDGSSRFGRNLPQSSIDMALRHLDVKRGSMTGNFRPSTKVPATSLYSVRSWTKRPVSSSESLESSVNILCLDGSDDNVSEISNS